MRAEYLVTGGGGFIGSNLVRALVSAGRAVRVLDDFSTGRRRNLEGLEHDLELIVGDIRDDRLLLFTGSINGRSTFYYAARAVTPGTYIYPPVTAACMYEPEIRSVQGGRSVTVGP